MSAVLDQRTDTQDPAAGHLLAALGERVRTLRAQRGMTRKILARDSGVSERYLALLENGDGNGSVLVLAKVAAALHVPVVELLREERSVQPERAAVNTLLKRLSPTQLKTARDLLAREFDAEVKARMRRIALVGLRGAGKSSLGLALANGMRVPFVELDREIEREAKTSLTEIFLLYGQAGYRRHERAALERVLARHPRVVISTGGSIVSESETYDLLLSSCYTVWLKAQPEEHMARVVAQGDTRPMKGNREAMEDLRRILVTRAPLYGRADAVVDTSGCALDTSLEQLAALVNTSAAKKN
jgi:XRE family transcriptional regulator, aerobic/anaerobic benzoate catabolism transcriptional regulator